MMSKLSNVFSEGFKTLVEKVDSETAGKILKGIVIGGVGAYTMRLLKDVMSENQIEGVPELDVLDVVDDD